MSTVRDIAIELFGEADGSRLADAEVYQRLAQDIGNSVVRLSAGSSAALSNIATMLRICNITTNINYPTELVRMTNLHTAEAIGGGAYEVGYRAQMEDSTAADATDRTKRLEELAAVHRMLC